ncbi:MAG TPA: NAD-dependent epimerase/dehydratase family protein [Casimicrobiaceae bacterium]|nr:NAD-dependent epimerase/dehydratase family protein [Casimicrobiaceae bacterium]
MPRQADMVDVQATIVVVTGATGFVGRHLCRHLARAGHRVRALARAVPEHAPQGVHYVAMGDLERVTERALGDALDGAGAVVHLAGRAHVLDDRAQDPLAAYTAANVEVTARVVAAAVRAQVSRLVFASSVKVNGETTPPGRPFQPGDAACPQDAYARSKAEAERIVLAVGETSSSMPTVLRLPLVYGPGVRGNFARLLEAIASQQRLPVGAIDNRRSIAYVGNVCSAIEAVLGATSSVRGVHFVADEEPVCTPQLVRALGEAMAMPARISHVPVPLLRLAAAVLRRSAEVQRLASSLEVDTSSLRAATGWRPSHTLAQGLAETAMWWRAHHSI